MWPVGMRFSKKPRRLRFLSASVVGQSVVSVRAFARYVVRLEKRRNGIRPRMHDLRHTFAVQTLLAWYRSGLDVERHLPILSTFLGHSQVKNTYWYLSSTPELLGAACERLETRWRRSQ